MDSDLDLILIKAHLPSFVSVEIVSTRPASTLSAGTHAITPLVLPLGLILRPLGSPL